MILSYLVLLLSVILTWVNLFERYNVSEENSVEVSQDMKTDMSWLTRAMRICPRVVLEALLDLYVSPLLMLVRVRIVLARVKFM